MALEGGENSAKLSASRHRIADLGERRRYIGDGCRAAKGRPNPDPGGGEPLPREELARILLALGRDVGMSEDARGRDRVAAEDVVAQRLERRDLRLGEG